MKTQIENVPQIYSYDLQRTITAQEQQLLWAEFAIIVTVCTGITKEQDLINLITKMNFTHFVSGTGGHHLCVKQKGNPDRILLVEFN